MDVTGKNKKTNKLYSSFESLRAKYGPVDAENIMKKLKRLRTFHDLYEAWRNGLKCHPLSADYHGVVSIPITPNYRLLIQPCLPEWVKVSGIESWKYVTKAHILKYEDYH